MVATSPRANSQVTSASTTTIFTAASRDEHPGRGPRAERPRAMDGRFDFDRAQLVGRARRTRCGTRRVQSAPRARWNAMSWRFSPTQKTRDDDTHFRCHRRQQQSSSTRKLSALFSRGLSVRPAETYGSPCRSPCRSPSARAFPGHARLCMHFVHHTTRLHITHTPPPRVPFVSRPATPPKNISDARRGSLARLERAPLPPRHACLPPPGAFRSLRSPPFARCSPGMRVPRPRREGDAARLARISLGKSPSGWSLSDLRGAPPRFGMRRRARRGVRGGRGTRVRWREIRRNRRRRPVSGRARLRRPATRLRARRRGARVGARRDPRPSTREDRRRGRRRLRWRCRRRLGGNAGTR